MEVLVLQDFVVDRYTSHGLVRTALAWCRSQVHVRRLREARWHAGRWTGECSLYRTLSFQDFVLFSLWTKCPDGLLDRALRSISHYIAVNRHHLFIFAGAYLFHLDLVEQKHAKNQHLNIV